MLLYQVEVPFEMKLNVSDTQFIVVEDSTTWDTNAVILKVCPSLTYIDMIYDDQDIIWWLKDLIVIADRNLTSWQLTLRCLHTCEKDIIIVENFK